MTKTAPIHDPVTRPAPRDARAVRMALLAALRRHRGDRTDADALPTPEEVSVIVLFADVAKAARVCRISRTCLGIDWPALERSGALRRADASGVRRGDLRTLETAFMVTCLRWPLRVADVQEAEEHGRI